MAALGPEIARSTPELKAVFERGLEEILSARGEERNEAIFQTAAKIGAVILARAVQDPRLSDEILRSVRQRLGSSMCTRIRTALHAPVIWKKQVH